MPEKLKVMIEYQIEIPYAWEDQNEADECAVNYETAILGMVEDPRRKPKWMGDLIDVTVTPDISEHEAEWEAADALEKKRMDNELKLTKGEVG